ncbi:hypothetical protein IAQ61_001980 [Plenodomus lingam]|uniref:uncharacterized protein n=1 Tax=Leptosphaeria maculans TaxID=5022 RepID=UPI00332322C2|nr:hypothetical protein IAQ61_001980 [Plenodomus lingam]
MNTEDGMELLADDDVDAQGETDSDFGAGGEADTDVDAEGETDSGIEDDEPADLKRVQGGDETQAPLGTDCLIEAEGSPGGNAPTASSLQIDNESQVQTQNTAQPEPRQAGELEDANNFDGQDTGGLRTSPMVQDDVSVQLRAQTQATPD